MSLYERLVILASKNLIIVEAISAFARKKLSLMVNNVENKFFIDRLKFFYPCIKHVRMVAEEYYAAIFYR